MRRILAILALCFVAVAPCAAQSTLCSTPPGGDPLNPAVINFSPAAPNASQLVTVSVGIGGYTPLSATATVQGSTINVMLNSFYINVGTPPPRDCTTTSVGPLLPGT